ncbi:hypothetical protein YPPY72_3047, partial [Yersinia pestis PY-72]|jgi:hypothetical protein
MVA